MVWPRNESCLYEAGAAQREAQWVRQMAKAGAGRALYPPNTTFPPAGSRHTLSLWPQRAHSERWVVVKAVHPNMNETMVYYITTTVKHVQGYRRFSTDCGLCEWQVCVRPNKNTPPPKKTSNKKQQPWNPITTLECVGSPRNQPSQAIDVEHHCSSAKKCHSYERPHRFSAEVSDSDLQCLPELQSGLY